MILFFGTKPGKPITKQLQGVSCSYCHQRDTLTAKAQPNYFHFFWIPLFKIGTSRFAECSHCKRAFYEEDFSEEMVRKLD